MAEPDKRPVTSEELLVSSLAQTDALAKLLIEKGLITREEFMRKLSEGTGYVSKTLQSHAAMTIADMARLRRTGYVDEWANSPVAFSHFQNRGIPTPALLKTFQ